MQSANQTVLLMKPYERKLTINAKETRIRDDETFAPNRGFHWSCFFLYSAARKTTKIFRKFVMSTWAFISLSLNKYFIANFALYYYYFFFFNLFVRVFHLLSVYVCVFVWVSFLFSGWPTVVLWSRKQNSNYFSSSFPLQFVSFFFLFASPTFRSLVSKWTVNTTCCPI